MHAEIASDVPGTRQQQLGGLLQPKLSHIAPVSDIYMRGVRGVTHCRLCTFERQFKSWTGCLQL
jgi:hypothetical protein